VAYRDGFGFDPDGETDFDEQREIARKTWGGWLMVASLLLGLVFAAATGKSTVIKGDTIDIFGVAGIGIEAALVAFLAWRVHTGKGWLAGSFLLGIWAVEVIGKLVGGTLNIGWGIFHIAIATNLFFGVRACWRLKGQPEEPEAT
jgi:hypothetical protein